MRRLLFCLGLCLAACGDPGLRDRSLEQEKSLPGGADAGGQGVEAAVADPGASREKSASLVGLIPDPLAPLYPADAELVLRFDDLGSFRREAGPALRAVVAALPRAGLGGTKEDELWHQFLHLPAGVEIDATRPLALLWTHGGDCVALVPAHPWDDSASIRRLDPHYCITGDPAAVEAFTPGSAPGYYLPGVISLHARPGAVQELGPHLADALADVCPDSFLDALRGAEIPVVPQDLARLDVALHFVQAGLRIDVRAAPKPDSPSALYLSHLRPGASKAMHLLPPDATAYLEQAFPVLDAENLLHRAGDPVRDDRLRTLVDRALNAIGGDASAALRLAPDGTGVVVVAAVCRDPAAAKAYLGSKDFLALMRHIAGDGGSLTYQPDAFQRDGVVVSSVTGSLSRSVLQDLLMAGPLSATISTLLRGPVTTYAGVSGDVFFFVTGIRARAETERFLDQVQQKAATQPEHLAEGGALFPKRLLAATVDLAALFDGTRDAAAYWSEKGVALRELTLRWRLPVSAAVTVEGGALRAAVQLPLKSFAEAAEKVLDTLAPKTRKH